MRACLLHLGCFLILLLAPVVAAARTLRVPADYPSIQYAINVGTAGDTVLVSPGVYNESVNFAGKNLYLASVAGPAATRIEPTSGLAAVYFSNGETSNAVISGFTLTNAVAGISIANSSPTIGSNVIVNCANGITVSSGSPVIENNRITGCYYGNAVYLSGVGGAAIRSNLIQSNYAGGIFMSGVSGSIVIANNRIQGNQRDAIAGSYYYFNSSSFYSANIIQNVIADNSGYGVAFWINQGSRGPLMVNNTLVNNAYGITLGGYVGAVEVINNLVFGSNAVVIYNYSIVGNPYFQNNDLYALDGTAYAGDVTNLTGVNGNISVNPLLACAPGDDFHLLPGSPCIGAGSSNAPYLPDTDLDGTTRNQAQVDMGAYAFNPYFPPTPCVYLNPPTEIVMVTVPGQTSMAVNYPVIDATPGATVTCAPPSGAVFQAGTNTVLCTAVYGPNMLTATFSVPSEVPPRVTTVTSLVSVSACSNAILAVGAYSTQPISYQWKFNGNTIANATNTVLVITNAQAVNQGYYQLNLANDLGSTNSPLIFLRVVPTPPRITAQPGSLTTSAGGTALLSGSVLGSEPLALQWSKDGTALYGATLPQLVISNAQAVDAGVYQLAVTNYLGSVISTGATLTVLPAKPSFVLQPVSTATNLGGDVKFSCLAAGSDDGTIVISYEWYFQSRPMSGQTGSILWLSSITTSNQGGYFVVASNAYGTATSEIAQLSVNLPPALATGLTNVVADEGSTVTFGVSAAGTPPLTYNWSCNYLPLTNTTATLTINNVTPVQSGFYAVTVSSPSGSISSTGRLNVALPACKVVAWGDNSGGQTDVPTNLADAVAVAGGDYYSMVLHHNGSITSWGLEDLDAPTNLLRYVAFAAGASHALGVLEDGSLAAWGRNDAGQAEVPVGTVSVLSVAAGDAHSLALLVSGQVVAWGDNTYGQLNLPWCLQTTGYWTNFPSWDWVTLSPNPVQAIAAHGDHSLALLTNGAVAAWGDNSFGESTVPENLSNAVAIAAGYLHSAALCRDGTVMVWGDNTFGQTNVPSGLSNVVAIAAGDFHTLALLSNGRVVGWGEDSFDQAVAPAGLTGAAGIACGYFHNLALTPVKQLTGRLSSGQLVLDWGAGILQWSPAFCGPYAELPSQGGSYTNRDLLSAPAKYYRVRY